MSRVCGVGINDYPGKVCVKGKKIKSYVVWHNMLIRCYNEKYQQNTNLIKV